VSPRVAYIYWDDAIARPRNDASRRRDAILRKQ